MAKEKKGMNVAARKKRMRRLEDQMKRNNEELEMWFAKFDSNKNGTISKDEMRQLLSEVQQKELNDPSAVLAEEALDKVMCTMDKDGDGEVLREHVLPAIKKYKSMLNESQELTEMFKRHDKDADGNLNHSQVLSMLQEVGRVEKLSFVPDDEDASWVISNCDKDQSGGITLGELKPAISAWLKFEKDPSNARQRASSNVCVLL